MSHTPWLWQAFIAGFKASGEGHNGEILGDRGLEAAEDRHVRNAFERWVVDNEPFPDGEAVVDYLRKGGAL